MAWDAWGQTTAAQSIEGVFEFNVVVPNAVSSFEAWGTKQNGNSGTGTTFQFPDTNPWSTPSRVDPISPGFATHGAARIYGRQVLVGDSGANGVGKLQVIDAAGTGLWHVPAPLLGAGAPVLPRLRSAAVYGRNGFIAVGNASEVWVTDDVTVPPNGHPLVTPDMNLESWHKVDLHTVCDLANHCVLAAGESPNFYGVARVGDANVLVGDDLTVVVYRPQPPSWVPRQGEVWEPWTRLRLPARAALPGQDATPTLRAVASDEVQDIIRPDARTSLNQDLKQAPYLDADGWALAVGDDGAAYRFRLHLNRRRAGDDQSPFYDAIPDTNAQLPGPSLQILTFTGNGDQNRTDLDADDDGYVDGDFFGVGADQRTRMIVGTGNRAYTFPRYAPFNDALMADRSPPLNGLPAANVTWRGVASDEVTWFLAGGGTTSSGAPTGMFWYGHADVARCRATTSPGANITFDLADCEPQTALPSTNASDYTIGAARVAMSQAGELEHTVQANMSSSTVTFPADPDQDVHLQLWKVNLQHNATGQQVEIVVLPFYDPSLSPTDPMWVFAKAMQDVALNRGFTAFRSPGMPPADLINGHIGVNVARDVINVDVFTGLRPTSQGTAEQMEVFDLDVTGTDVCGAVRDQVDSGVWNTWDGGTETALDELIGGFSRFRSGDGHAFVDQYEDKRHGGSQRYQSMKHYVYGRCRVQDCRDTESDLWVTNCCESDEVTARREFVDVYAPFDAKVIRFPRMDGPPPGGDTTPLSTLGATSNPLEQFPPWAYPAGWDNERQCNFYSGDWTYGDISHDDGRLALFLDDDSANAYRIVVVFDHLQTCLGTETVTPVTVTAGQRVGRFMSHGETEVQLWVNDRFGRWRLMSYFDELPDQLYAYYVAEFGLAPRGTQNAQSPVIPLEDRDRCPVLPEAPPTQTKLYPDDHDSYTSCTTYAGRVSCPTSGCPTDLLWAPSLPGCGINQPPETTAHPGLPAWTNEWSP